LHYTLGFPPFRSGGLVRYVADLACQQRRDGHEVFALYPGGYRLFGASKLVPAQARDGMEMMEIDNPSPVALLQGIRDPERILAQSGPDPRQFEAWIAKVRPDILHVHTWMGMPPRLPSLVHRMGGKVVFTAHDYYGLCLRTVLVDAGGVTCQGPEAARCAACNAHAQGRFARFLHGQPWLHTYKAELRKLVSSRPRTISIARGNIHIPSSVSKRVPAFASLIEYNLALFQQVDRFHFASSVSEGVYRDLLAWPLEGERISISHLGIVDLRAQRVPRSGPLRMGFIGDSTPYKGLPWLLDELKKLREGGVTDWILDVHGPGHEKASAAPGVEYKGVFSPGDLAGVYASMDLLIVPSRWKETFSLVALEALSHGVPVLCSPTVGAGDLVKRFAPSLAPTSQDAFLRTLTDLLHSPERVQKVASDLALAQLPFDARHHALELESFYARA
jgi:glycosyltransferase involved in cell wall biosynthesis